MSKYKDIVSRLTLLDALPWLHQDRYASVRALDAEREALAKWYEERDGEILAKIRMLLTDQDKGNWSHYRDARELPGSTVGERLRIAAKQSVPVMRWSAGAAYPWTHCRTCGARIGSRSCFCYETEAEALDAHGFHEDAERLRAQSA